MRKKIFFIFFFFISYPIFAEDVIGIVISANADQVEPPRFRQMPELKISGSGQFSEKGFEFLVEKLPDNFVNVDLRKESHGFVCGHSIGFYGKHNWANRNKSPAFALWDELLRFKFLRFEPEVEIHAKDEINTFSDGELNVSDVVKVHPDQGKCLTERQFVESQNISYWRFFICDHIRPDDDQVEKIINLFRKRDPERWLHFHCSAGRGRTTTLMALFDMLAHGAQFSFDQYMQRQIDIGGVDLRELGESTSYKFQDRIERLVFLKLFYEFASIFADEPSKTWQQFLRFKCAKARVMPDLEVRVERTKENCEKELGSKKTITFVHSKM